MSTSDASAPKREPVDVEQYNELLREEVRDCLLEIEDLRRLMRIQQRLIDQQRVSDLMTSDAWEEYRNARGEIDAAMRGEPKEGM
jgi:hypothetical protein